MAVYFDLDFQAFDYGHSFNLSFIRNFLILPKSFGNFAHCFDQRLLNCFA